MRYHGVERVAEGLVVVVEVDEALRCFEGAVRVVQRKVQEETRRVGNGGVAADGRNGVLRERVPAGGRMRLIR